MGKLVFKIIIIHFLIVSFILSQNNGSNQRNFGNMNGGKVFGKVIDFDTKSNIEYSNIVLSKKSDSTFVNGTVTDKNGVFELNRIPPGEYYLNVRFMGYETQRIENIKIARENRSVDVGTFSLKLNSIKMDDVEVVGERSGIEYKIDKKVVNVAKHYTAASGTAVDVLENVPSVNVDVEGNVTLRGSGNFTLLIDNRPTVLDANDALQQIPASTIEDIEIITNPSAKFDPEGPSGIINIVMKKEGLSGTAGIVNINAGLDDKYGGDFLVNYKTGIINTYIGADYNKRYNPGTSESENITSNSDRTSYINSNGLTNRGRNFYGFRGGLDFDFNKSDYLGFGFRIGNMDFKSSSNLDFESWNSLSSIHNFYSNKANSSRGGNFYALNSDYKHVFGPNAHDLSAHLSYRTRNMEEESITRLLDENNAIKEGLKIDEDGPSSDVRFNVDYRYPFSETNKFEMGYQNSLGNSVDKTSNANYDPVLEDFVVNELYLKDVDYQRNIQSAYALYSGELGSFGYQGGLRSEYTYRKISLKKTNEEFKIDRWDYFPTLHFSFKFNDANQFNGSYTKRISRPHGGELEPFETWTDAYSVRKGNPALKPEGIDSYEFGYQHYFSKNLFSVETYYRITNDKIENIKSVYPDHENVILSTVYNIGNDYSFGTEVMMDLNLIDWWKINLSGDLFDYEVSGVMLDKDFSRKSTNWRSRINNSFTLTNNLRLQVNASYNSPTVSSQGRREGFVSSNLALRYKLFEFMTATLQLRDLFSSAKNEFTSEGIDFYNYYYSVRKSPEIMVNLNININNYKQDKNENGMDEGRDEEDF